ncbi:chromate transporter [Mageeibacillus indolicus]|jgi:hypothetical protein|uniref:Chromate transport protein n=2 Tax=Mageeibacillus indolicus TaxID=884684 RepID=D3R1L5_MAGIU|nr:chromate transporter [Mageeibacillus indolicus]ADC91084.1 chromate transport protein [Mageeibacillus indolicus UPII9-5]KFA57539.1 hypothetical protein HMPREF1632_02590 [Mageeibacillus indolicus 0009-5]PNH19565.1 hypothetical protein B7R76_01380 [Mageeibacillus indolicus]
MIWRLFWNFFRIGIFAFGGGYAVLPLIQRITVDEQKWFTPEIFADLVSLAEMTPGPLAVNAATFAGRKVGDTLGSLVATVAISLPAVIIVVILAVIGQKIYHYNLTKHVLSDFRPMIVGLIAAGGISLLITAVRETLLNLPITKLYPAIETCFNILVIVVLFCGLKFKKLSPVTAIIVGGLAAVVLHSVAAMVYDII